MLLNIRNLFVGMALLGMICGQTPLLGSSPDGAASQAQAKPLSAEQLDKLLAPIALYPDPLLAQILPAATVPHDVVLAARYVAAKKDPNKIDQQSWEESVKALARYPDVLKMMDEKLDWTTNLGEAFSAQPKDIFNSVQRLRAQADAAGNLKTSSQQVIVKEKEVIKIMPADPQVIYVPVYQPSVVYVVQPVPPVAPLITFGAGLALGIWIHNEVDWHHHHVYYHNSGWHGGYHGGGNNVNIDNSTNINIGNGSGNGNGNKVGNGNGSQVGSGNGNVWTPQSKPKPAPYGSNNNNWSGNGNGTGNRSGGQNFDTPSTRPAQQKPASRPAQTADRNDFGNQPGFAREGTKPRPSTSGSRPAPAGRSQGGGNFRNR